MKKIMFGLLLLVISLVTIAMTSSTKKVEDNNFTVHEWGTFTSVSGSDGQLLDGLYLEEERLPGFVHQLQQPFDPKNINNFNSMAAMKFRGPGLPLETMHGVNIKMETPVIYFYSDKEREVDVNVEFKGGIMNQWYPDSVDKKKRFNNITRLKPKNKDLAFPNLDKINLNNLSFHNTLKDSLNWKVKVLSPDSYLSYTNRQEQETPTWINPRFVDANMLQIGKDREKFIFYRGLARFKQPFMVSAQSDSQITIENTGSDEIGFALVYEYTSDKKAKVWWTGKLNPNEEKIIEKKEMDVDKSIHQEFMGALVKAGLYKKEAKSMLETWRHSYFEKEGIRVFWIVPRKFTDEILPLKLNPAPKNLERVLVGRAEVLTPEFEEKIVEDFTTNTSHSPYWLYSKNSHGGIDRYFKAWQARVNKLLMFKGHKFSFLKKISGKAPQPGEFVIHTDKKDQSKKVLQHLGSYRSILEYSEKSGKIDGKVIYNFTQDEARWTAKVIFKRAEFHMKNGKLDGECKIFELKGNNTILLDTKTFKDGKEVL